MAGPSPRRSGFGREPGHRNTNSFSLRSIQREARRLAAEIGGRVERLALQRMVAVLYAKRRARQIRIVGVFAVAGQHLGAAIEPGALADIDTRAPLLVLHVRSVGPVIGLPAVVIGAA